MAFIKVYDLMDRVHFINESFIVDAMPGGIDEAACRFLMSNGFVLPIKKLPVERREWERNE